MFLAVVTLLAGSWLVREHWSRLHADDPAQDRYFWKWLGLGAGGPLSFWGAANLGIFQTALVPSIAQAQFAEQRWSHLWVGAMLAGAFVIALNWLAFTYVWMMARIARKAEWPDDMKGALMVTAAVVLPIGIWFCWRGGWGSLAPGLMIVFGPMVMMTLPFAEKSKPLPLYAKAVAKMKFGKYKDAELEVIKQLERKEDDFDGWMMLAELYAVQQRQLEDASKVVVDLCNDPAIEPVQISIACNKLADWHLQIAQNPVGARAALDLLIQRLPGTHFAHMAAVRRNQIPRTREEFVEGKKAGPLRLPALRETTGEPKQAAGSPTEAMKEADKLVARLTEDPNHIGNREKLAIVFAERLGKVDMASEQLRLLTELPDTTEEQRAKWLAQIASWERSIRKDEKRFVALLEEILRDYPKTTQALAARRQLDLMEMERLEKLTPKPEASPRPKIRVTQG